MYLAIYDRQITPGLTYKKELNKIVECSAIKTKEISEAEKKAINVIERSMKESDLLNKYLPFIQPIISNAP